MKQVWILAFKKWSRYPIFYCLQLFSSKHSFWLSSFFFTFTGRTFTALMLNQDTDIESETALRSCWFNWKSAACICSLNFIFLFYCEIKSKRTSFLIARSVCTDENLYLILNFIREKCTLLAHKAKQSDVRKT